MLPANSHAIFWTALSFAGCLIEHVHVHAVLAQNSNVAQ